MARTGRQLELKGVFASAITPHRAALPEPDFGGSLDLIEFIGKAGVQAICLLDSTGEFLDYTFAERQRLVYLLLLMPPYFFRYSQREIEHFYMEFAREATDAVPILLHNAPQNTSPLEIDTVRRLADTGRFAGIVDAGGIWQYFEQLMALRPLAVFTGCERLAAQALREGADGIVSGCASAVPELVVGLARGDERARERLMEFVDWVEKFPAPVAIKRAVELRGQKSGAPMAPLSDEASVELEEFSRWFKGWIARA
jgi:dihydrodipicolinate synthase/N-acetylneuraminate lyase